MSLTDLSNLIALLRENGVMEYKTDELSLVLAPLSPSFNHSDLAGTEMPKSNLDSYDDPDLWGGSPISLRRK
jgi:hypothetical protein